MAFIGRNREIIFQERCKKMTDKITDELLPWEKISDQEQWFALLLGNGFRLRTQSIY
jgi:hypothetical protein